MTSGNSAQKKPELSGVEKAAALLLFMGKDTATKLATFFTHEEIESFISNAGTLKNLEADVIDQLIGEFKNNYLNMGMFAEADNLSEFFKEFVAEETQDEPVAQNAIDRPANEAGEMPGLEEVIEFLDTEPEYIGVFLLASLDEELVAEVFSTLEPEKRKTFFKLYMDREPSDPKIEKIMRDELFASIAGNNEDDGSRQRIETAASVMNFLPEDTGTQLMDFINSVDPEAADVLKKSLFRFSEIVDLGKEARSLVFDGVEPDTIVQALQTADEALREVVLDVLSQRNRRMIEAELARGGVPEEVTLAAQRKISSVVLKLAKDGKISLEQETEDG